MVAKKSKGASGRFKRKTGKKARRKKRAKTRELPRIVGQKKTSAQLPTKLEEPVSQEPPTIQRFHLSIESISGDTAIGDLLVVFPRTREVLVKKGLRLEAENAGDIYMTLDAFSALNGLKTDSILQELVEAAKEPPVPPAAQVVTPPAV